MPLHGLIGRKLVSWITQIFIMVVMQVGSANIVDLHQHNIDFQSYNAIIYQETRLLQTPNQSASNEESRSLLAEAEKLL